MSCLYLKMRMGTMVSPTNPNKKYFKKGRELGKVLEGQWQRGRAKDLKRTGELKT